MDINEIKNNIEYLEHIRMHYTPLKYVKKYVKSTKDIYEERRLLKSVEFDSDSIEYFVDIIVKDLKSNSRFRRMECLKVLKRIIKNRSSNKLFSKKLINDLFYIYQTFILTSTEEIQWAVSTLIKDQPLEDEQINWLIDNFEESEHIVNRLLRYPTSNRLITNWARQIVNERKLQERVSEVIGILIEDGIPENIKASNKNLMWAIYYSKVSEDEKRKLILKHLDYKDYSCAIDVAMRLGISEVSQELLSHYCGLLKEENDVV
ncbi:hypothetical protein ABFT51_19300 [Paenibacillus peoriae]|uniref:hypothetical protein n=1 Tax=Paenibacillus peoriae TaxID=59893 RepID=UPI0032AF59DC